MIQKGPMPGATPKQDALAILPKGARCQQVTATGITGYERRMDSHMDPDDR